MTDDIYHSVLSTILSSKEDKSLSWFIGKKQENTILYTRSYSSDIICFPFFAIEK